VVEEIIGRLPKLTEPQLGRLEEELRRERQRRASSVGGGRDAPGVQEGAPPPVTEVLEYRPHADGYLQLELRATYVATARPGSVGPTGTSNSTREASARSSTSARPTTRRGLWPPSEQSPLGKSLHLGAQESKALRVCVESVGLALLLPLLGCKERRGKHCGVIVYVGAHEQPIPTNQPVVLEVVDHSVQCIYVLLRKGGAMAARAAPPPSKL
jgi:hypothetical protein